MPFLDTFTAKNQGEDRRPSGTCWPAMAENGDSSNERRGKDTPPTQEGAIGPMRLSL